MKSKTVFKTIGRYKIEDKIGEGTFGIVYRGQDPLLNRDVAIKIPKVNTISPEKTLELGKAFYNEAQIAGNFTHTNIVTVFDVGRDNEMDYLVMEFVPGRVVDDYFGDTGIESVEECLDIIHKCCIALDFVHFHGIIHRDIKPGNIIYNRPQALVKLTDFSISHYLETKEPVKNSGTLAYMAPEHFLEAREITFLTDIFALGCTMYKMLSGKRPFNGNSKTLVNQILYESPTPLWGLRPDVPEEICAIVDKAMAKQDADRYQSALEFAADLKKAHINLELEKTKQPDSITWPPELEYYTDFRQNDWFRYFSPDQIQQLLQIGSIKNVENGDDIITEGEVSQEFFLLIEGQVMVMKKGVNISLLESGACFGDTSLLGEITKRAASVRAIGDAILWNIDSNKIEELSAENRSSLFKTLLGIAMERLEELTGDVATYIGDS
ncbi:MAG TPA: cyclic nucleotide-binding domain-containing protein [Thiotrichaceae bacterium]|jgi:serine/threonine-protein kinase|nr:cyclic nucleotide-binding domain-containing protein [Thiotrichaceae bacterium]HIK76394.1 cyclic nucleotide-binding domain-containing protein [Gammaproteobacteria bacterium]